MAMTTEELLLQMKILTDKTDSTTNPNMVYKTNKTLNKGLNPEYYSGNNTRIVNILNELFAADIKVTDVSNNIANKVNDILRDTGTEDGLAAWQKLQAAMGKDTIIDGLNDLFEGNQTAKLLGITNADINKILSVAQDEQGNLVLKAIDQIASSEPVDINAENIDYTNSNNNSITNVKQALDYVIDAIANGDFEGGLGGGTIIGDISWDMIDDRPMIVADNMEMNNNHLYLKDGDSVVSSVPIADDEDITNIINNLD